MSRGNPKKMRKVVRASASTGVRMGIKTKQATVAFLVGGGLSMIASPSLGFILLGIAGILEWQLLLKKKWMQRVRRNQYARVGGYVAIGTLSVGLAIYPYLRSKEPTTQPITATVQNSPESRLAVVGDARAPVYVDHYSSIDTRSTALRGSDAGQ